METSQQLISQEKREIKSKETNVVIWFLSEEFCYYRVLDETFKIKYTGRIERSPSLTEGCTCPDQFHRNNKAFKDSHGYSLQCKHMIQAKKIRGWS